MGNWVIFQKTLNTNGFISCSCVQMLIVEDKDHNKSYPDAKKG